MLQQHQQNDYSLEAIQLLHGGFNLWQFIHPFCLHQ